MRKGVYITLIVLLSATIVFAGTTDTNNNNNSDTITGNEQLQELFSEYDSTIMFPAYEIYCQWDTNNIHPYEFATKSIHDTSVINLIDEYNCGYAHPFCGEVTSDFGMRKGRPHYGIDIKLQTGDTVVAAFGGMVRIAKRNKTYGNVVIIRHDNGLETFYAHLSKLLVNSNDYVEPGQVIGLGGNTGRSYGSHLHFEVRYKGLPINPNEIISFENASLVKEEVAITSKTFAFASTIKSSKYHTVRKGDTLYGIAKRYGTTPQKLCKMNGIKMTTTLRIGMKLKCG